MKKIMLLIFVALITFGLKSQNRKFDDGFVRIHQKKEAINPLLFENKGVAKPISIIPWKQKKLLTLKEGELLKVLAYELNEHIYYMYFVFSINTDGNKVISIYEVDPDGNSFKIFSSITKEYEEAKDWKSFNRSTVFIIDNYLYFEMGYRENYDSYYEYRYALGSKSAVESEGYLDNFQETINQTYNHKQTMIAEALNGELSLEYLDTKKHTIEFITKDFHDGFIVGNLSWSLDDKILYFDNHSTGLACIWRYNVASKELSKIVPEHEAEQAFAFSYKNKEYVMYIEKKTIKLATP